MDQVRGEATPAAEDIVLQAVPGCPPERVNVFTDGSVDFPTEAGYQAGGAGLICYEPPVLPRPLGLLGEFAELEWGNGN
eukprot:15448724-Alexandrium_andersonii.AAC.1